MQHYSSSALTDLGKPAGGASITVKVAGTMTNASIFSDDGVTAKSNPFTANNLGQFDFYAASGKYDITISGTAVTTYTLTSQVLFDPFEISANNADTFFASQPTVPLNTSGAGGFAAVMIAPLNANAGAAPISPAANNVSVFMFTLPFAVNIGRVAINVQNTAVGTADVGIYTIAGNRLIYTNGGFNTNVSGWQSVLISGGPIVLPAGIYYFAQTCSSATPTTSGIPTSFPSNTIGRVLGLASNAASAGVLPATLGTINAATLSFFAATWFER